MNAYSNITPAAPVKAQEEGLLARIDAFFVALGQGVNAYRMRESRMAEIRRLNAKSDAELLALGVTRDTIPQYVFRDLISG